ncbi:MAG TPA: PepSY domain-containing protein [Candidatus Mediterraneibacter avicola]|nr:PepSY domain-containing protein [Candidatus Mediterraneibacter avicola]
MRKKILAAAALASAVVLGVFTGCGNDSDIGREAALEAALNDAGVSESDATRLKVSEDRDDGRKVYEIRFDVAEKEYDYEIQASDGTILSSDVEINENYAADDVLNDDSSQTGTDQTVSDQGASQNQTGTQDQAGNQDQGNTGSGSSSGAAISQDEAVQIALERVPGATAQDVRIELDRDDGRYKYEGEIIYNNTEYDFEIDANSGTILEWSEERY